MANKSIRKHTYTPSCIHMGTRWDNEYSRCLRVTIIKWQILTFFHTKSIYAINMGILAPTIFRRHLTPYPWKALGRPELPCGWNGRVKEVKWVHKLKSSNLRIRGSDFGILLVVEVAPFGCFLLVRKYNYIILCCACFCLGGGGVVFANERSSF